MARRRAERDELVDYLSEFSAFYGTSARGYENVCRRLHFFTGDIERGMIERAAAGDDDVRGELQARYLGFATLRPFEPPLVGRTVLRWYPDVGDPALRRVIQPSRQYRTHLAGIPLTVEGVAWQQQDTNVGACATVALWSMMHSSAFDDHHAIPTTASITRAAHEHGLAGHRLFPSTGLTVAQIGAAIQRLGLSPIVLRGDGQDGRFSCERLVTTLTTLIRSSYPVLVAGRLVGRNGAAMGDHAVCVTGFRATPGGSVARGSQVHMDLHTSVFYLHDDNLGPNVRFELTADLIEGRVPHAVLVPTPPLPRSRQAYHDPTPDYPKVLPHTIIVAVHDDLRTSTDELHKRGEAVGKFVSGLLVRLGLDGVTWAPRFVQLRHYTTAMLNDVLGERPEVLARVRLALVEKVPPMSLHLGLVRICVGPRQLPLLDVLYDTTELKPRAFAHVVFEQAALGFFAQKRLDLGVLIDGAT